VTTRDFPAKPGRDNLSEHVVDEPEYCDSIIPRWCGGERLQLAFSTIGHSHGLGAKDQAANSKSSLVRRYGRVAGAVGAHPSGS
jgi:hypothetical protein